eukprot:1188645-Prorocentrum_minimum.AAC.3
MHPAGAKRPPIQVEYAPSPHVIGARYWNMPHPLARWLLWGRTTPTCGLTKSRCAGVRAHMQHFVIVILHIR